MPESVIEVTSVLLNNGVRMPQLGIGTSGSSGKVLQKAIEYAIDIGYRHIDTAHCYGNETDIGEAIARRCDSIQLNRSDLFITTKIPAVHLGNADDVNRIINESLQRLRTEYVDLLLMHHPWGRCANSSGKMEMAHYDLVDAWRLLESVACDGRVRCIGVSNFTVRQLKRVCDGALQITPAVLQLECNAYLQQSSLRKFCQSRGIVATAYSPLGSPAREARFRHPGDVELLADPVIADIAQLNDKTPAQVLLRFLIHLDTVPLPKSIHMQHIADNLAIFDFSLSAMDIQRIQAINRNLKLYRFEWFAEHPEYFFDEAF